MRGDDLCLVVEGITKAFDQLKVLRRISLSFACGECVLLLGANGAGKSTFLRLLAGLSRADSGKIESSSGGAVGFFSQHLFLYGRLTTRENLKLFASLAGHADVDLTLKNWGLSSYADTLVQDLSKGNQSRVALARAFLGAPSLLILDEPSSHLDEQGVELLARRIAEAREASQGRMLTILATHDLHRLGKLATRVISLARGEVAADSGPQSSDEERQRVIDLYREGNR
jgi:ABC-type multidrug transport system ATPase subunit